MKRIASRNLMRRVRMHRETVTDNLRRDHLMKHSVVRSSTIKGPNDPKSRITTRTM